MHRYRVHIRMTVRRSIIAAACVALFALVGTACGNGGVSSRHTSTAAALSEATAGVTAIGENCIGGPTESADCATRLANATPHPSPTRYNSPTPSGKIIDCNPGYVSQDGACVPDGTGTPAVAGTAASSGEGSVDGQVLLGPTCPVERVDSPCADRPAAGVLLALDFRDGRPFTTLTTDSDGRFRLAAPAGSYVLSRAPCLPSENCSPFPRIEPQTVVVQAGAFTTIVVHGDTGIR